MTSLDEQTLRLAVRQEYENRDQFQPDDLMDIYRIMSLPMEKQAAAFAILLEMTPDELFGMLNDPEQRDLLMKLAFDKVKSLIQQKREEAGREAVRLRQKYVGMLTGELSPGARPAEALGLALNLSHCVAPEDRQTMEFRLQILNDIWSTRQPTLNIDSSEGKCPPAQS